MDKLRMNPIVDVRALRGRWLSTLALAIAGAFIVVERYAFGATTAGWIGFAVGIAVVAIAGSLMAVGRIRDRSNQQVAVGSQRRRIAAFDLVAAMAGVLGGWQIVESLVFSTGTQIWLTFANGCALVGVALAGLLLHELSTERVVHSIEVVGERGHVEEHEGDGRRTRTAA